MKNNSNILLAFAMLALLIPSPLRSQGDKSARNTTNKMNVLSFNKYLPNATVDKGYYALEKNEESFCLEMTDNEVKNKQHYMILNCFDILQNS